jgi:hypothetical protein
MNFHFKQTERAVKDTIIFTKANEIFELNFITEEYTCIYKYPVPFERQPQFFSSNADQTIFLVASPDEARHVNLTRQ